MSRPALRSCRLCTRAICAYPGASNSHAQRPRLYPHKCRHGLVCRAQANGAQVCIPCQLAYPLPTVRLIRSGSR